MGCLNHCGGRGGGGGGGTLWLVPRTPSQEVRFEIRLVQSVMFLGKTLFSHNASLNPGVQMCTVELLGKPDEMPRGNLAMD